MKRAGSSSFAVGMVLKLISLPSKLKIPHFVLVPPMSIPKATKSSALACENFMLAARAYGYDTCPMEGYDARRVRKLLKLPSDAATVMVISVGKRSSKGIYGPQIRFPRESFIFKC